MDFYFDGADPAQIKKERAKAKDMRKTSWWQQKLSLGCYYCGKKAPVKELTMDHIVPLARGGKSSKGNIVACCKECNNKKKSMLPLEWEEYMERLKD